MRIFLSSTFVDLAEHRQAVAEAVERLGQQGVRMEVFGARPEEPQQACLAEIDGCDLFVGIYAHRYGFVVPGTEVSITETEYDHAEKSGKPILCFTVHEDHPWPPKMVEAEPGKSRLARFKERVGLRTVRDTFTTPADLALKVATSIGRHLSEGAAAARRRGELDQVAAACYRRQGGAIEFLLIRTSGRRWMFPKGGVEPGETPARAAQREAFEEAGVAGRVSPDCLTTFRHLKQDLKRKGVELKVGVFLLEVQATQAPGEEHRDPTWFSAADAVRALAERREFVYADELRRVVEEACAAIRG